MLLKQKDRPELWLSDATSPEERKTRERNQSMGESGIEDEILKALKMVDDIGTKIDIILNKLTKLENIELRLENLYKSMGNMEESFAAVERDVQALKDHISCNL